MHSKRGFVDMAGLAALARVPGLAAMTTVAEAFAAAPQLGEAVAEGAWRTAAAALEGAPVALEIAVFSRDGRLVGRHGR